MCYNYPISSPSSHTYVDSDNDIIISLQLLSAIEIHLHSPSQSIAILECGIAVLPAIKNLETINIFQNLYFVANLL